MRYRESIEALGHNYVHIGDGVYKSEDYFEVHGFALSRIMSSDEKIVAKVISKIGPMVYPEFIVPIEYNNSISGYMEITGTIEYVGSFTYQYVRFIDQVNTTYIQ